MNGLDEDRAIADLRTAGAVRKVRDRREPAGHVGRRSRGAAMALRSRCARRARGGDRRRRHRVSAARRARRPRCLLGSHSDSVPYGGWLDGAMGVHLRPRSRARAQASRIRTRRSASTSSPSPTRRGPSWPAAAAALSAATSRSRTSTKRATPPGERFADRLDALGLADRPLAKLDPARHRAFLEAHIEQGPRLIDAGRRRRRRFRHRRPAAPARDVSGPGRSRRHDADGDAPRRRRGDARLRRRRARDAAARAGSPDSVWNIGVVSVKPGAANVVPNEAEIVVEFRDLSTAVMDRMDEALQRAWSPSATASAACASRPR